MADENISMVRGDTLSFGLEYDGTQQDLDAAFFTCRNTYDADTVTFQKSLGNGIEKIDTGKYVVRVAPEDTRYIDAGTYYYDFQVSINGDVYTLLKGALEIEHDVTH